MARDLGGATWSKTFGYAAPSEYVERRSWTVERVLLSIMVLSLLLVALSTCFAAYTDVEALEGNTITAWVDEVL